jgi:hypothetical protein
MKLKGEAAAVSKPAASRFSPPILLISLLASLFVVGGVAVTRHFSSDGAFWPLHPAGDAVTQSDAEARAAQFAAQAPLPLTLVPESDELAALDGMGLDPRDRDALAAGLNRTTALAQSTGGAQPADAVQPANPQRAGTRLAWITLWDTDAEDGDVVRLDSAGYSRTVTLTKKAVVFAVPVPQDGVIKVTGVRDGEGGGITVGLASGAQQAVFPIMSVGQTLGLKVTFDR